MQCSPVYSAGKVISVGMRQTFSGDLRNDFNLSFLFASVAITELLRIISSSLCLKFEYVNKILPGAISHHSIRWWVAWRGGTEFDRLIQIYLMKPDEYLFDWSLILRQCLWKIYTCVWLFILRVKGHLCFMALKGLCQRDDVQKGEANHFQSFHSSATKFQFSRWRIRQTIRFHIS